MSDALQQLADLPDTLAEFAEPVDPPKVETTDAPALKEPEAAPADPLVEKARASGWRPKEEFDGDPDQWVDAGEFVRRKPLFDQLHQLKKELKSKAEQIEQVSAYAAKAAERARAQALAEVEAAKKQAFEAGDYQAFAEAQQQEQQIHRQAQQPQPQEVKPPPELVAFSERNARWFEKDQDMTDFAVAKAEQYVRGQGLSLPDALQKVEADVKRAFAHKFVNPNKDKPAAVVAENGDKRSAGKLTYNDLSKDERAVWNSLKNHMTFDEFIKDLR